MRVETSTKSESQIELWAFFRVIEGYPKRPDFTMSNRLEVVEIAPPKKGTNGKSNQKTGVFFV